MLVHKFGDGGHVGLAAAVLQYGQRCSEPTKGVAYGDPDALLAQIQTKYAHTLPWANLHPDARGPPRDTPQQAIAQLDLRLRLECELASQILFGRLNRFAGDRTTHGLPINR